MVHGSQLVDQVLWKDWGEYLYMTECINSNLLYEGMVMFRTMRSRDRNVVLVKRTIDLRCWEFGVGGDGEGIRKGRSVYEQPGTKVDRVASHQSVHGGLTFQLTSQVFSSNDLRIFFRRVALRVPFQVT